MEDEGEIIESIEEDYWINLYKESDFFLMRNINIRKRIRVWTE